MKKIIWIPISLLTLILASCEIVIPSVPFSSTATTSTNPTSSSEGETTSSLNPTSSVSPSSSNSSSEESLGYAKNSSPTMNINQYRSVSDNFGLPTTGDVKLLVIPVTFTDYRCGLQCATRKEQIRKSFFGEAGETSWHSVKSFYETSSYGALTLTGVVTDWYDSSWSSSQFSNLTGTGGDYDYAFDPTWAMLDAAIAWYKSNSGSDLTEYDTDSDGFIDSVYLVYNNPNSSNANYSASGEEVFWAYTYWNYNNFTAYDVQSPVGMTLVWSSYDFMFEGYGAGGLDAHTYIHELGHAFGLDDYYTYSDGDWGAAGGLDMMDFNILDHNAFSKYLLGWANPFVLTGNQATTTIKLKPFESSGEFFLLGNAWNGSAFDNYLIFEFYTPTGINQKDSVSPYPGNNVQGFTVPGIKIYHVDARLGRFSNSSGNFVSYTDSLSVGSSNYPYVAHSNTVDRSINENYRLLHLLEQGGTNTFINDEIASNDTLFRAGDSFNPTTTHSSFFYHAGGRFNDQSLIGYEMNVTSVTDDEVTFTLTQI